MTDLRIHASRNLASHEMKIREFLSTTEKIFFDEVMDAVPTGLLITDGMHHIRYCNRAFCQLWNLWQPIAGLRNDHVTEFFLDQIKEPLEYREYLANVFRRRRSSEQYEIILKDGRTITEKMIFIEQKNPQSFIGRVWIYEDISAHKKVVSELQEFSECDDLTGLFNRRRFRQELDRSIIEAGNARSSIALLLFDLDGFKLINDQFGHQAGDLILVEVANRIKQVVRSNEMLFRLGGDEFAVLMRLNTEDGFLQLARRLSEAINQKYFLVDKSKVSVTTSIGIAVYPLNVSRAKQIVQCADQAMYQAKLNGKNKWVVYTLAQGNANPNAFADPTKDAN